MSCDAAMVEALAALGVELIALHFAASITSIGPPARSTT